MKNPVNLKEKPISYPMLNQYMDKYHKNTFNIKPFGEVFIIDCPYCKQAQSVIIKHVIKKIFWCHCTKCKASKDSICFFREPMNIKNKCSYHIKTEEFKLAQYIFTKLLKDNVTILNDLRDFNISTAYDDPLRDRLFSNILGSTTKTLYGTTLGEAYTNIKTKIYVEPEELYITFPLYVFPGLHCGYHRYSSRIFSKMDIHKTFKDLKTYTILKFNNIKPMVVYPNLKTMFDQYPKDFMKPSYETTNFGTYLT